MKQIELKTRIDPGLLPELYSTASESTAIEELRVVDWNLAAEEVGTLLYAVDGDADAFLEGASETNGIDECSLSDPDGPLSYALVSARPAAIPFFSTFMTVTARAGMVVRKPLVYRNGHSRGYVVGDPEPLQAAIDETPAGVNVTVERIGRYPSGTDDPWSRLSDRQQEAVETAAEMGYYRQPREATHADIAAALDCAPNTATTHIQKGEAKLVRCAIEDVSDTNDFLTTFDPSF